MAKVTCLYFDKSLTIILGARMDSESILGFHVRHGSHVGVQNNSEKSLGNLILLLCKT